MPSSHCYLEPLSLPPAPKASLLSTHPFLSPRLACVGCPVAPGEPVMVESGRAGEDGGVRPNNRTGSDARKEPPIHLKKITGLPYRSA
jgi:hypothetical protein